MHDQPGSQHTAHGAQPMACILCGQPIADGPGAPTTDGYRVHIRCADAQAAQAFKRRQRYALIHAGVWGVVVGVWGLGIGDWGLDGIHWMFIVVAGAALHVIMHRRWWQQVAHPLRPDDMA
jgi:hypothetical protein